MKLKHQVGLLLAVPLLFQTAFASVMMCTVIQLDQAAKAESKAKQILACCQTMREIETRYAVVVSAQRYVDLDEARKITVESQQKLTELGGELKLLLATDTASLKDLADYENNAREFAETLPLFANPYKGLPAQQITARFIRENDRLEELMSRFRQMMRDETAISSRYRPVVAGLQPASIHAREQMFIVCIAALTVNVLLVGALGVFFGKYTVSRLRQLMDNIHAFAKGNTNLAPVSGNDELAELNDQFSQIAQAKLELEEQRRAMYGMVSHDLRSPLTSMTVTLGTLLESSLEIDPRARISLARMLSESKRLVRLSSSFLDGQKFDSGKLELSISAAEPKELIEQALSAVSASAQLKGIARICLAFDSALAA